MKKIIKAFSCLLLIMLTTANAQAVVYMDDDAKRGEGKKLITLTGFVDYAPLGYMQDPNYIYSPYENIFEPLMSDFAQLYNLELNYIYKKDYNALIREVRSGKIDIILGIYHQTKIYNGIDYVFPSILNNPVMVVMLPHRIDEISTVEDLKKLKGGISDKERLSDYVASELDYFQVERFPDYDRLFEKLFKGEIDYAFVSQYSGLIAVSRLGLRNKVSFAKQMIWNMPLFIGVGKMSPNRKYLLPRLVKFCEDANNKQKLEQHLIKTINDIETKYLGAVPPNYAEE